MAVFGNTTLNDHSNVKAVNTKLIPNVGDEVFLNKKIYTVTGKLINYSQIENYDLNDPDRGGEIIYVFLK